jgi:hypothetical protein
MVIIDFIGEVFEFLFNVVEGVFNFLFGWIF